MAGVPSDHECKTTQAGPCHPCAIQRNYGTRPFKCPFVGCLYHRIGFETTNLRQAHRKNHDRPWRCDAPACEYGEIGFLSRKMRDDHLAHFHATENPKPLAGHSFTNSNQLVAFLFSLIRADETTTVHSLLASIQDLSNDQAKALLEEVVSSGSYNMIETVGMHLWDKADKTYPPGKGPFYPHGLAIAIISGNVATLKWIAAETLDNVSCHIATTDGLRDFFKSLGIPLRALLNSRHSGTLYDQFQHIVMDLYDLARQRDVSLIPKYNTSEEKKTWWFSWSIEPHIISATSGQGQSEEVLISLWRKLNGEGGGILSVIRQVFGMGLRSVAATTCSITLASSLIDLGADPSYNAGFYTAAPLQLAAQKDTNEAASLIRFLLYRGANPDTCQWRKIKPPPSPSDRIKNIKIKITEEVGTKGISKWLNKSWEELVAEAREARRNNTNPPVPED